MKIAVYGDSFGDNIDGWPKRIAKKYNADIHIYAEGGTSIDYSYLNFINTHEKYDMVFFIWTNECRTSLIIQDKKDEYKHIGEYHSFHNVKYNRSFNVNRGRVAHASPGRLNKDWVYQQGYNTLMSKFVDYEHRLVKESLPAFTHTLKQEAMKDSVKFRRPDCVIIKAFPDMFDKSSVGMSSIQEADLKHVLKDDNVNYADFTDDQKIRKNHLSDTQNKQFAKYLFKHIEDSNFDIHDTMKDPTRYYTMSKDFASSGFVRHKWT
jgi:hypothetical protein